MTRQYIQLRRDTAAAWTAANPVLRAGEAGYESDVRRLKIGDGSTTWNLLPYTADGAGLFLVDAATAGTIYVGTAMSGTSESAASWSITRSLFNSAGIRTSVGTADNVTWTGRSGHIYV